MEGHMQENQCPVGVLPLTWHELPAFFFAWFGLIRVAFWLRWRSLAWVWRRVGQRAPLRLPVTPMTPQRLAFLVNTAAAYAPFPMTCLPRALFLWGWLRQYGLPANLRLGVRKQGGMLLAHAWLEYEGVILNDNPAHVAQYAPFDLVEANSLPGRCWF